MLLLYIIITLGQSIMDVKQLMMIQKYYYYSVGF